MIGMPSSAGLRGEGWTIVARRFFGQYRLHLSYQDATRALHYCPPVVNEDLGSEDAKLVSPGVVVALLLRAPVVSVAIDLHEDLVLELHVQAETTFMHHGFAVDDLYAGVGQEAQGAAFQHARSWGTDEATTLKMGDELRRPLSSRSFPPASLGQQALDTYQSLG